MGAGVVTTDAGGTGDFVEHQRNGLLVRHGDVEGLRDSLLELYRDEKKRFALAKEASATVRSHFSLEKMKNEIVELCS